MTNNNESDSKIKDLNPLQAALKKCRTAFWVTFGFAFVVNLLMLITPLYSLQVLDRVIGSSNLSTLLMLSLIIGFVYFIYGLLQVARSFTLIKIGEWLDHNVTPTLFSHSIAETALKPGFATSQLLREFQTVKTFLTSTGINTIFDAPWSIVYIIAIFMIHPYLGYLTVAGSIIIITLALLNAMATNKALGEATEYSIKGLQQAEIAGRNAEVIEAMGMMKNVIRNWHKFSSTALQKQSVASYRNGVVSNFSRLLRNMLQMSVTGIGAYIVVSTNGQAMTTGGMIASSILMGRALAPFDNAIELWKNISAVLKSYKRINGAFAQNVVRDQAMEIPCAEGKLSIENISFAMQSGAPGTPNAQSKTILNNVSFEVESGDSLAIIGPSAAGKSTLAKMMVGVWKPNSGNIRLDGAEVYRWNREDFGNHVGYLPQGIELFNGTIKQNIARMSDEVDPEKVVAAAKLAGAHDMILNFPEGYDSDIGVGGSNLSGGQKQRVGLARAFYGNPKLIILDEPNANLDEAGEIALAESVKQAKTQGITIIVISHRPSILNAVDKMLILQNGQVLDYGKKEKVHKNFTANTGTIHIGK